MKLFISKKYLYILFFIIIQIKTDDNNKCSLTRRPSADPFPSLLKCYKYNNEACCLSVHDDYIDTYINQILSPSCVRKFPLFEILMCFGCHPNEFKYINTTEKELRICKSFAEELWGPDLNDSSTVFDQCGFKVETDILTKQFEGKSYIIPSEEFHNFTHFLKYIKIPYYEDYNITIQEETNEFCYNGVRYIDNNILYFTYIIIFIIFCLI